MRSFDPESISLEALRRRRSAKWRHYEADVLPAWIAEMDFPLADPIASALRTAIADSDTGYQWSAELQQATADFAREAWSWEIRPDRVTVLPDVLTAIALSLEYLTEPGHSVVITPPVYPPFFSTPRDVAHRHVVEVPLSRAPNGSYSLDVEGLERAFARPDAAAFLLCNPHNPTGAVATRAELERIAALAGEHGVLVVSDEIHAPLVLPGSEHVPYLTVAGDDANAVAMISASKAWNLAGLKAAQLVTTERTTASLAQRIPLEHVFTTGHFGVLAALAAYRDSRAWLADAVAVVDGQRALLAHLLAEHLPRAQYVPPQASFLAWVDLARCGLGPDPAAAMLERGRVALSSGPTFGTQGEGFVRVNIATSPAILREIVTRMASVVQ